MERLPMKVIPQSYSFPFQSAEEFSHKFAALLFGKSHDEYLELKGRLTIEEIEFYKKSKAQFDDLTKETQQFAEKIRRTSATDEDYARQRERDAAIKSLKLDPGIAKYLSLEENISRECSLSLNIRNAYLTDYNPNGRRIKWVETTTWESPAPIRFRNLEKVLGADGAIIDNNKFDDMLYRGGHICGRTDGKDTWPLLMHAEKTKGFALFFIQYEPLTTYCSTDSELKKARELAKAKDNVIIVTDTYYETKRFY